jgi:hypothetical protein
VKINSDHRIRLFARREEQQWHYRSLLKEFIPRQNDEGRRHIIAAEKPCLAARKIALTHLPSVCRKTGTSS